MSAQPVKLKRARGSASAVDPLPTQSSTFAPIHITIANYNFHPCASIIDHPFHVSHLQSIALHRITARQQQPAAPPNAQCASSSQHG